MAAGVVADRRPLVLGEDVEVGEDLLDRPRRPTRCPRARRWRCRRRPCGADRGGCASSPRRCAARARRTRTAGRAVRRPSRGSFRPLVASARRICSAPDGPTLALQLRGDRPAPAPAGGCTSSTGSPAPRSRPTTSSTRVRRTSGTRSSAGSPTSTSPPPTRSTPTCARSRSTSRSRSAGSRTTSSTSATSAAAAETPTGRSARSSTRDFGSVDAWRSRPQGDGHGRPRLGVDGVRLGRGPPLQLRRRRPEHVPGLERDAARRARRLRARLLPRLPDGSRLLHRRVLRQPRLGRRERLVEQYGDPAA